MFMRVDDEYTVVIMSSDQLVCDVSLMETMIMRRCYMTMMYYDDKLLMI